MNIPPKTPAIVYKLEQANGYVDVHRYNMMTGKIDRVATSESMQSAIDIVSKNDPSHPKVMQAILW